MENSLSPQEYTQLLRRKINELKIVTDGGFFKSLSYSMTYSEISKSESSLIDLKSLSAVLLRFRAFYLQKEEFNFNKICKFYEKNISSIDVSSLSKLREYRRDWELLKKYKPFKLQPDGIEEDWFDLWLYGENYHIDIEKSNKIESIRNNNAYTLSEFYFLDKLQKYVIFLLEVDAVIFSKL